MKQFLRIDEEGYYIEPVIVKPEIVNGEPVYNVPDNLIEERYTEPFHKPRWTGSEWVDEITKEELDERRQETDAQPKMMSFQAMSVKLEQTEKIVNELIKQFILADDLTDEQKEIISSQYRKIGVGDIVYPDEIVNINGELFKYVQPNEVEIVTESWLTDASLFTPFLQAETDDGTPIVEEFKQPTGAHDAYQTGDLVLFNGKVYQAVMDNVTWSPADYPQAWELKE